MSFAHLLVFFSFMSVSSGGDDLPDRRLSAAPTKESDFLVCVLLRSTRRRKARTDINRPFAYGIARST